MTSSIKTQSRTLAQVQDHIELVQLRRRTGFGRILVLVNVIKVSPLVLDTWRLASRRSTLSPSSYMLKRAAATDEVAVAHPRAELKLVQA